MTKYESIDPVNENKSLKKLVQKLSDMQTQLDTERERCRELSQELTHLQSRELPESERCYHRLFDAMQEGFGLAEIILDEEGKPHDYRILEANSSFGGIIGATPETAKGRTASQLFPNADPRWIELFGRVALSGEPAQFEKHSDSLNKWFSVRAFCPEKGQIAFLLMDITERKMAEQELQHSRNLLSEAESLSHTGAWEWDLTTDQWTFSDEWLAIHGCRNRVMTPQEILDIAHPEDRGAIARALEDARNGAASYKMEHRILRRDDGSVRFVHGYGRYVRDASGKVVKVYGFAQDITERKRAGDAVRASEERLRQLLAVLPAAMYTCDADGVITYYNEQAARIWGRSPRLGDAEERFCGALRLYLSDGSPLPHSQTPTAMALNNGESIREREVNIERPDGTLAWISVNSDPLRDASGKISGAINVFTDITERRKAEEALRNSESRYRSLFQSMEAFTLLEPIMDAKGRPFDFRYLEVNDAGARLRGRPAEAILGRTILELFPAIDRYWIMAYSSVATTGEPVQFERLNRVNGLWYRTYAYCPEKGKVASLIIDITDRKMAEKSLQELTETLEQRVAERTELAEARTRQLQALAIELIEAEERERRRIAELLHDDLQQLLASGRMQLQVAREGMPPEPLLGNVERLLEEAICKARRLSHELSPAVLHHSGLVSALQWLVRQMSEQFGLHVDLEAKAEQRFENAPVKVFLFRAVQELLFNVVKHAGVKSARIDLSCQNGGLMLTVSDQGQGFNPDILNITAITPGFGLLSIRERAQHIGGSLKIESKPGQGSRFTLTVPLSIAKTEEPQRLTPASARQMCTPAGRMRFGGADGTRVLFVDDHQVMRQGLIRMITGQPDIKVVGQAANGREALERVRHLKPDVVVMDVSMPEMDGIEATRRIKAELPEVRVIGLSMYEEEHLAHTMRQAGAEAFLSKTASSAELLKAIYGINRRKQDKPATQPIKTVQDE